MNQTRFQYLLQLKNLPIFFILAISVTSVINLPLSPICVFLTYAVCCEDIKSGKTSFSFSERAFDITFSSAFTKEMGLLFL